MESVANRKRPETKKERPKCPWRLPGGPQKREIGGTVRSKRTSLEQEHADLAEEAVNSTFGGSLVNPKNVKLEALYDHIGPSWSKSTQTLLRKQQIPHFASAGNHIGKPKVVIS